MQAYHHVGLAYPHRPADVTTVTAAVAVECAIKLIE